MRMSSDIKLTNSATSMISAKESVELLTNVNRRNKRIQLENALHVPDLRTNLLSMAKIVDKGYRVVFESNQACRIIGRTRNSWRNVAAIFTSWLDQL